MSVEAAKACIERIKTDEDFAKKVGECKTKEERIEFVRSIGYDFTYAEFHEVTGELTDDELDSIAGGVPNNPNGCRAVQLHGGYSQ
mgnify:CR=1 FL=1